MDVLASLWKLAGKPDSSLGRWYVGRSPQHVTMTPLLRVLDAMEIGADSVFVDIGSGHGLVTFAAALYAGARLSYGIEIDENLHRFSAEQAKAVFADLPPEQWPVRLLHVDVAQVKHAFDWTHSYSFDRDFPPEVLAKVASLFVSSTKWRVFASSLPQSRWREVVGERWWDQSVRLRERLPIKISGSGEQHSIYVYERTDRTMPRRSSRLARVSALQDETALARSRYEAHLHPASFGSETQPNRWIPRAVTRALIRSGGSDAFECALPGLDDELDPGRANMLARRGSYAEDLGFASRSEIAKYLEKRASNPEPTPADIRDEADRGNRSIEAAIESFSREVEQQDLSAGDIEQAVEAEREQDVVREKRSIDAYHAVVARIDRHLRRGARFLDPPVASVLARTEYAAELKRRARPSDDLPETILAGGSGASGAAEADDELRVSAERVLITQMEEFDLLVRPVPPIRVRDLASMPGFSSAMHAWIPPVYALFAFSCSMDISLLSYAPMTAERYAVVSAVARLVNYIRDAKFEALSSTEPDATVQQRSAAASDLGLLANKKGAVVGTEGLVRDSDLWYFPPISAAKSASFSDIVLSAATLRGSVPTSLWIELKEGNRPTIDANAIYRVGWKTGTIGFGYSVRSFIVREQKQRRGDTPREIVLARDEALEWHLFDCGGRRQGVCMPFAVPIGSHNPVGPGAHRVEDPLEESRSWTYDYDKAAGSVFVLLERDMDALAGLHEEYPLAPPKTPVVENATFAAALRTDLVIHKSPPPSSLATRGLYPETRLDQVGLAGGLPAFDCVVGSPTMRYEGSARAMAVALAMFHMNDSMDVPLLLRYPIKEPIDNPDLPGVAQQIAADRFVGLVVAPMRLRGWERIRATRFAVARHYLVDSPSLLVADSFRFLRWFYGLYGYDAVTKKIIVAVSEAIDRRSWVLKKATSLAWIAIKTALAIGFIVGVANASASAYAAPGETLEAAATVGGEAFRYGWDTTVAIGSFAGSAAINNMKTTLTAAVLVAGARPAEALAYLFGISAVAGRVAASKAPFQDRKRFAFKLYFSDTVSLEKFAQAVPAPPDGGGVLGDDQLRAVLNFARNGLPPNDNPAYDAIAVKQHRDFPRVLISVDNASDEQLASVLLADASPETWLEKAGQQRTVPAFSIAVSFNLDDATIASVVGKSERIPLRLESKSGTYDLASIVWRSKSKNAYFVVERNKQGTYWCLRVDAAIVHALGTVKRENLRDALSMPDARLLVHKSGRKSLWPTDSGEIAIGRSCTFLLYNNSMLYPTVASE